MKMRRAPCFQQVTALFLVAAVLPAAFPADRVAAQAVEPHLAGFAEAPDGTQLYVADTNNDQVAIIDVSSHKVGHVRVGHQPMALAISTDGSVLYVANAGSSSISIIDTTRSGPVVTVGVGSSPTNLLFVDTTDGSSYIYVANTGENSVSIINAATNAVETTVDIGDNPAGLAVDPTGRFVYVISQGGGRFLAGIDTLLKRQLADIDLR